MSSLKKTSPSEGPWMEKFPKNFLVCKTDGKFPSWGFLYSRWFEGKDGMKGSRLKWKEKLLQLAAQDPPYCCHRAKLKVTFSSNTFSLKWSNDVLCHSFSPILSQRPLSMSNVPQVEAKRRPKDFVNLSLICNMASSVRMLAAPGCRGGKATHGGGPEDDWLFGTCHPFQCTFYKHLNIFSPPHLIDVKSLLMASNIGHCTVFIK